MTLFYKLHLTEHQTVFEYDDTLDDDKLPYHPGYIKISEIDLYQQYQQAQVRITFRIMTILRSLYDAIDSGHYVWIYTNPQQYGGIFGVIMSRLACITNEYNHYEDFIEYLKDTTEEPVQVDPDAYLNDPRFVDDVEYQLRLSQFILDTFLNTIGENETAKLFAKHYGDIVNYLFYRL